MELKRFSNILYSYYHYLCDASFFHWLTNAVMSHIYIHREGQKHTNRDNVNYRDAILLSDSNDTINQGNEV